VTPDDNKTIVLRNGIPIGLNVLIPFIGHNSPIWISGDSLEWKNAQKNDRKKKISDTMKRIIPISKPFMTSFVWSPFNQPSRVTSRHQHILISKIVMIENITGLKDSPHIQSADENVKLKTAKDPKIGHGLTETKW